MSSIDIYAILQSKPHNPHYLNRYYKFILACKEENTKYPPDYPELHHICPKAKDMFPEYINTNLYPDNSVELTFRQHLIAHIMLWKSYGDSQAIPVHYMLNVQNGITGYMITRKIPTSVSIRYAEKAKDAFRLNRLGKATFKDSEGNYYYLDIDDPKISEMNLVGHVSGRTHNDETVERMKSTKLANRKIPMTFLDLTRQVQLFSDDYENHIQQGWLPCVDVGSGRYNLPKEDLEYRDVIRYLRSSESLKGRSDYCTPDGKFYGKLYSDDPIISELGLVTKSSVNESVKAAAIQNSKKANEANLGTSWYNNGTINKKFKEDPGGEWIIGQLPIDLDKLNKRKAAASERCAGTTTYNDGVRNYRVKPGDYIDPSWVRGMAPQKKRIESNQVGTVVYNDGLRNYRVLPGQPPDPSWVKGMVSRRLAK